MYRIKSRFFKKSVVSPKKSLVFRYEIVPFYEPLCYHGAVLGELRVRGHDFVPLWSHSRWDKLERGLGFTPGLASKLDPLGTEEANRVVAKEHWKNNP